MKISLVAVLTLPALLLAQPEFSDGDIDNPSRDSRSPRNDTNLRYGSSSYGGYRGYNRGCKVKCENGGYCGPGDTCVCVGPYYGDRCQIEKAQCQGNPPTPSNGGKICTPVSCTLTCRDGYEFPDGTKLLRTVCRRGKWQVDNKPWDTVPDCQGVCEPKCENGGKCIGHNTCSCPSAFRGPQCQYGVEVCDHQKLGFNGHYECSGDAVQFVCSLTCPKGMVPDKPFAKNYICLYEEGRFTPSKPPSCKYENSKLDDVELVEVTRGQVRGSYKGLQQPLPSRPKGGSCYIWSRHHFKLFSGRVVSFKSDCLYTLLSSSDNSFRIDTPIARPGCDSNKSKCTKIELFNGGRKYTLSTQEIGGRPVVEDGSRSVMAPAKFPGLGVELGNDQVSATLPSSGVTVVWNYAKESLEIKMTEKMWNKTSGICGNPAIDSLSRTSLREYASLSRVNSINDVCDGSIDDDVPCLDDTSENSARQFCSVLLNEKIFESCRQVVKPKEFYEACVWERCECKNKASCGCQSISFYAKECLAKGVSLTSWRSSLSQCRETCKGGKVYQECGVERVCGAAGAEGTCSEGCFCPAGSFLNGDSCVPKEQCNCQLRGKWFPPGSSVPKECNTCMCVDGQWSCTEQDCPGRCESVGDPHYTTFDRKKYDFMGKCSYYLVSTENYTIEAENVPCDGTISKTLGYPSNIQKVMPSCTKSVTVRLGGKKGTVIKLRQAKEVTINGEEAALPASTTNAYIRHATSIYLQLVLDDGVEIWWDGITSLAIHMPPIMKGKTKGLCGTFTGRQSDDLTTPEGDVETDVTSFADKWRTSPKCQSLAEQTPLNPCEANPENSEQAHKLCAHLTSNLFSYCHPFVDPSKYHADCLYDVCSCRSSVSECLCPVLAAYAKECTYQGVITEWRSKVRQCGLQCPRGQEYGVCWPSCSRTCQDLAVRNKGCSGGCMEGCACPSGFALDNKQQCVPLASCPCVYKGLQYPPGHIEVRRSYTGFQKCTCENALWACDAATSEDMTKYPNSTAEAMACSASRNLVYTHCEPSQPLTCQNMHRYDQFEQTESICYGGCVCKKGYVLDSISKECVLPEDCPCHHGGKSYSTRDKIRKQCNTCECNRGNWTCSEEDCDGRCSVWGESHFKSFDGKIYDFHGSCEYMLSKGFLSSVDSFSVVIEMVACGSSGASCSRSVTFSVGSSEELESVIFSEGKATTSKPKLSRILVREAGLFMFAEAADLGVVVQWDKGTRATVRLDSKWKKRVKGLCGNFNEDAEDDFQTPSGGITEASPDYFCDSWKLHEYCPQAEPIEDSCDLHPERKFWSVDKCSILKSSVFKKCHSEVPVGPYLQRCIFDTCACDSGGDCDCLCTAIAAYAQECNAEGVSIVWRSQQLCPIQCDESCSSYSACVPTCPPDTCDNSLDTKSSMCEKDICVEGCKMKPCPVGQVYSNLSESVCVPRASCKPVCLVEAGVTYFEGDLMEEDPCHTCHCSRGSKSCSGEPCAEEGREEVLVPTRAPVRPLDEPFRCRPGWTQWFNRDHPADKKNSDNEPLPTINDFNKTAANLGHFKAAIFGACLEKNMVDISCRTAYGGKDVKEYGEDVECSLERGLVCINGCHDYEIRVKCSCGETTTQKTTTPEGEEVRSIFTTAKPIRYLKDCIDGEEWDECSVRCPQLCHYYNSVLIKNGVCSPGTICSPGCRSKIRAKCPSDKMWRDPASCIAAKDCTCRSHSGKEVKPGEVVSEGECETCQCLENTYVCQTKAECRPETFQATTPRTTVAPLTTRITTPTPRLELTPPPPCSQQNFVSLVTTLPDSAFSASSQLPGSPPSAGKFNLEGRAWRPAVSNEEQYIQADLGRIENVYGVSVRGVPGSESVQKYFVLYSIDDVDYKYVTAFGQPELFSGPVTTYESSQSEFLPGVTARYVRVKPTAWLQPSIALSMDLFGCGVEPTTPTPTIPPVCEDLMSHAMSDSQVSASSTEYGKLSVADIALKGDLGWEPLLSSPGEYLQFDLLGKRTVTGLRIAGSGKRVAAVDFFPSWVTALEVSFSADGTTWSYVMAPNHLPMVFEGNKNSEVEKTILFERPIRARLVRVLPTKWNQKISLRAEVLGCYEPYPEVTTITPPVEVPVDCNLCPGASVPPSCPCKAINWWDGEQCVLRAQCPCYIGFIPYSVGTSFENEACEQCVCGLNGVPKCSPKPCPPCTEEGTVNVVTSGCGCLCKPCGLDQRICPTSQQCIAASLWCDGVQDCLDDEVNCTRPTTPPPPTTIRPPVKEEPKCPVIECPPGFLAEETAPEVSAETQVTSSWSPFGSASRWGSYFNRPRPKGSGYGAKGKGRKGSYSYKKHYGGPETKGELATTPVPTAAPVCPLFKCVPIQKDVNVTKCPPKPTCLPGYSLQSGSNENERCEVYSCVEDKHPDGKCNVTGRTVTTFDGLEYKVDICDHVLAKDETRGSSWKINQVKECKYIGPCTKYLLITQLNDTIKFRSDLSIEFNNYNYTLLQIQKIGAQLQQFAIKQVSDTYLLFSSIYDFSVIWDTSGNVRIIVPGKSREKLTGLCGWFDGDDSNDKRKPDGSQARTFGEFAEAWAEGSDCETRVCPIHIQKEAFTKCSALREAPLSACGEVLSLESLISQCVESMCSCLESNGTDCRCQALLSAVTRCTSFDSSLDLSGWRIIHDCRVACANNLLYQECFKRACEPCCSELMVPDACPATEQCFPGCYCPDGYVREGDKCIKPSDCRDCVCEGYSQSRFVSFDKQDYTFRGNCTFVLAQSVQGSKGPYFKIYGTNGACEDGSGDTCLQSVTMIIKDHTVHAYYQKDGKLKLLVDGVESDGKGFDWLKVHQIAGSSVLLCLTQLEVDLEFLPKGKGFSLKIPSHFYFSNTEGLCGSCNLNAMDDFKTSYGNITSDIDNFGVSWRVTELPEVLGVEEKCGVAEEPKGCELPPPDMDPCLKLYEVDLFGRCHAVVNPNLYVEKCHLQLCSEEVSQCHYIESYVRECQAEGICLDWRSPSLCPYYCSPGLVYKHCTLGCTLTCENHEQFSEDPSRCKAPPRESCICPDGQVVGNETCVAVSRCAPCDTEGHYPGDEWSPDVCTTCQCAGGRVDCRTTACPPEPICPRGHKLTLIKATQAECCPKQICVEELERIECPKAQQPVCGTDQKLQLDTDPAGCKHLTCRCLDPEECPSTAEQLAKKRAPGMVAHVDSTGCCPKVVESCEKSTCPAAPPCPPLQEVRSVPPQSPACCPTYSCAIPDGKCLYNLTYSHGEGGGEKQRAAKEQVLKDVGEVWWDGPCRKCECQTSGGAAACSKTLCSPPPESPSYTYRPKYVNAKCCPIYERTACKVNGKLYQVNDTWKDEVDLCKSYCCKPGGEGEVSIQEETQTCKTDCPLGWEYEKQAGQCCGACRQTACVIEGSRVYEVAESWSSPDNCTRYSCESLSEQPQVVTYPVQCPDVSSCPKEYLVKEACCDRCDKPPTPESQVNCGAEAMASNETIGVVQMTTSEHGLCRNVGPLDGFTQCQGACPSFTSYKQGGNGVENMCQCCEAVRMTTLQAALVCEDGFTLDHLVKVPSVCSCNVKNCKIPPTKTASPYVMK